MKNPTILNVTIEETTRAKIIALAALRSTTVNDLVEEILCKETDKLTLNEEEN